VRWALRYTLVYAVVLLVVLGALWVSLNHYISAQAEADFQAESTGYLNAFATSGVEGLVAALATNQAKVLDQRTFYFLRSPTGASVANNLLAWPEELEIPADGSIHGMWIEDEIIPGRLYQDDAFLPASFHRLPDGHLLLLARPVEQAAMLQEVAEYLFETLSIAMVLALVMAITIGQALLKRMDTLGRAAVDIAAGDLSQRIPASPHNDEFDMLAQRLNTMLERIQQLIHGMREVTDNTAHDLRSPLTRLRNRLDVVLLEPRSADEYRQAIQSSVGDADDLLKTFNALLSIAQMEAGHHRTEWSVVDLSALVADIYELYKPVAEEKSQQLDFTPAGKIQVMGSRQLLAQALANLIENAIKYTPQHGQISIGLDKQNSQVCLTVVDNGLGIPADEREHVLARFVRLDVARHTSGNGLGLSLVSAVAKLHRAELQLTDARPGLSVSLRFSNDAMV